MNTSQPTAPPSDSDEGRASAEPAGLAAPPLAPLRARLGRGLVTVLRGVNAGLGIVEKVGGFVG